MTTTYPRADPAALADFDPASKLCTMNCGPAIDDPRSAIERRFLCPDCVVVRTEPPMKYAYSFDGERYQGEFDTRDDAIAAALDDADGGTGFRTARIKRAFEYLIPEIIGNRVVEHIDESLVDDITWDDDIVTLSAEDQALLGRLIINFMRRRADWHAWGVTAVCDHARHDVSRFDREFRG